MKIKVKNSSLVFVTLTEPTNLYDSDNDLQGKKITWHVAEGTAEGSCVGNNATCITGSIDVTPGSTIRFSFVTGEHYDRYQHSGIGLQNGLVTKGYESQQNDENWCDKFFYNFDSSDGRMTADISIPSNVSKILFTKSIKPNNSEYYSSISDIKVYEIS